MSRIRTEDRAAYIEYVSGTGIPDYQTAEGNLGCQLLVRDLDDGTTEVTTISWWRSTASIQAFAGEEFETARYYPEDDRYLLAKPETVEHHEVVIDDLSLATFAP